MASVVDEFDHIIENLKATVRKSFARVYAALKARELITLRQLDALHKQCQDDKDLKRNCVQNIKISYESEPTLLDNVSSYGTIDFERLNFDSNAFTLEEYISPKDDHMYCYKTIEEVTKLDNTADTEAIEEAAIKEITKTENCVCHVHIHSNEVAKKFRDISNTSKVTPCYNAVPSSVSNSQEVVITDEEKSQKSDEEVKKIDPTDEWINSIKGQTETEPSQVADVMEHSTITCP